jgi:hypothetical protein
MPGFFIVDYAFTSSYIYKVNRLNVWGIVQTSIFDIDDGGFTF